MNFRQAISSVFSKYAQFGGVARRSEYWWWTLFCVLVSVPLRLIDTLIDTLIDGGTGGIGILSTIWALGTLLPSLAVTVRRLRDAGYAWGFLFLALIPLVGWIIQIVMLCQPTRISTTALYVSPVAEPQTRA